MFKNLFRPRTKPSDDLQDEIMSICRNAQIEHLNLSAHLRKDTGLDCGCLDQPGGRRF